jgi:sensor histidine kinase YesM
MNNRHQVILLHIAVWAVIFLSPLTFINHGNGVTLPQFAMISVSQLSTMIVFYANYCWLTSRYFLTEKRRFYWIVNIIMVIALGIATHYWMSFTRYIYDQDMRPHPEPSELQIFAFILRNIFNLAIAAAIATAIQMGIRWNAMEHKHQATEKARAEAELKNLRAQINPHFLLNTLNNIYALTAFDAPRAQNAIQELSKMLRHVLYDNDKPYVTLDEEVQFLENYIHLMRIRLTSNVDVQFTHNITEGFEAHIAPLLFISLVENAFKHGVSPTLPSFIHINIEADKQHITCCIKNSNFPKTAKDRSGHGIGLQQVQSRLDLSYPDKYEWQQGTNETNTIFTSKITLYDTQLCHH